MVADFQRGQVKFAVSLLYQKQAVADGWVKQEQAAVDGWVNQKQAAAD